MSNRKKCEVEAKRIEEHFRSKYILGESIKEHIEFYGEYDERKVRVVLILSNGWYSKWKSPPDGHSQYVENLIAQVERALSSSLSIDTLIKENSLSIYNEWCWLAESDSDILSICFNAVREQMYSDGDWDTKVGRNYIIAICYEFSGS